MLKNQRGAARSFGLLAVLAVFAALLPGGTAQADQGGVKLVAPSGAAADPAAPAGAAKNELEVGPERALAAWDCPAGYSCYYTGLDGGGSRTVAPSCGFWYLGPGLKDNLYSIHNRGNGVASVYNWIGHGYQLVGWVHPGVGGNFHNNVGADLVHILC
jgi:hypothetical protein